MRDEGVCGPWFVSYRERVVFIPGNKALRRAVTQSETCPRRHTDEAGVSHPFTFAETLMMSVLSIRGPLARFTRRLVFASALLACGAAAAAPKAYVGNFKDSTVSVVDTASGAVVATIPVATGPHGMAISGDGRTVYVTGDGSSSMSIIDTASDSVAQTIEVGPTPHGIALLPDGKTLLVGVYGADRVAFVDTASRAVVASVAVAKPHTIAVRPDGKVAYVASQQPGQFALVVIDLATRAVVRTIALDKPPRDPEFSHDGRFLYVTTAGVNALRVIDASSDKVVGEIATGASPHIGKWFAGAAVGTVVVQGPGELLTFDPASQAPGRAFPVGKQPHWMASDGKTVWVTNEGSNDVSAVDLASGKTATIAVGNAPRKIVVQPATTTGAPRAAATGASVSIANFAFAPAEIVVAPGASVSWRNDDGAPHALAFADGAAASDLLLPGASFTRSYPAAGSFDYVCSVHPYMQARVIVRR
jgi:YVTN family beta-propeller protein